MHGAVFTEGNIIDFAGTANDDEDGELTANISWTSSLDGAIGVGKYVHEDVYVRYGRTLSRDPVDEVSVEFRINENWSVESQASSDENAGADLIWSFEY